MAIRFRNAKTGLDLPENKAFTLYNEEMKDNIKYPKNWLSKASEEELEKTGFTKHEVIDPPKKKPIVRPMDVTLSKKQYYIFLHFIGAQDVIVEATKIFKDKDKQLSVRMNLLHGGFFDRGDKDLNKLYEYLKIEESLINKEWMKASEY